jgi:hypothetical protein
MKESKITQTLLHEQVDNGLYAIISVSSLPHKPYGLITMTEEKTSIEQWQYHLGHPSNNISIFSMV